MCPAGRGRGRIVKGPPKVPANREMLSRVHEPRREGLRSRKEVRRPRYCGLKPTQKAAPEQNTNCSALQPKAYVRSEKHVIM